VDNTCARGVLLHERAVSSVLHHDGARAGPVDSRGTTPHCRSRSSRN